MPLLDLIRASRTSVQGKMGKKQNQTNEQKTRQSGRRRMTESVVGDSGQPMPQPLQADGTEDGPVRYGPHHMVLT